MRRVIRFLVGVEFSLLVALGAGCAHPPPPASSVLGNPEELIALERAWSRAVIGGDRATTARLLADDFIGIDGRGKLSRKADEIAEAGNDGSWRVLDEQLDDFVVRFYGEAAVVTARNRETVQIEGRQTVVIFRRTTVWVRRDGAWRCVSFHGSKLAS